MKKIIVIYLVSVIATTVTFAQVELLKDMRNTTTSTPSTPIQLESPEYFIALGNKIIFRAYDDVHGWELWVTDNTHEGTDLLKDLSQFSSEPMSFTALNGLVYFAADTPNGGRELWKTDGTPAGTTIAVDVFPGAETGLSFPEFLTEMNGVLYFIGQDESGSGLWKSDGTPQGTVKIKALEFDTSSQGPFHFAKMNDHLYFNGFDEDHGYELWKSDGTAAGTVMVKDLAPGSSFGYPRTITTVNDNIYFVAFSETDGMLDLWKSDGTTEGTEMLQSVNSAGGAYPTELKSIGGLLFFTTDDNSTGRELWRTDGTLAGTYMIKKASAALREATQPTELNGVIFFTSDDGNGRELWKTDGTPANTVMVKDIRSGPSGSFPGELIAGQDELYFVADDQNGKAVWKSDGTDAGTTLATYDGVYRYPQNLTYANGFLYFSGDDMSGSDTELMMYDAASESMINLGYRFTYHTDYTGSSNPSDFIDVNGLTYFNANGDAHSFELWKTDGTPEGTQLVKTIAARHGFPNEQTATDGLLFFVIDDEVNGYELWKSDGTPEGTVMVKDIRTGPASSSFPSHLTFANGTLYFSATDDIHGTELWKSDGTETGTVMVKDIYPGDWSSSPYNLTAVGNTLYFAAYDGVHINGLGLWKSDGTEAGTVIVNAADSPLGSLDYSTPGYSYTAAANDILYFQGYTADYGNELWKTDGTDAGTVMVKDIVTGTGSSYISALKVLAGAVYFLADDGVHGEELWKSDGTEVGTVLLKDIYAGSATSYSQDLAVANNLLFFAAVNTNNEYLLWRTDGTDEGTFAIESMHPNASAKDPGQIVSDGSRIYFTTFLPMANEHLWTTDGTTCGTVRLTDEFPDGIGFRELFATENNVLFSGDIFLNENGVELYRYNKQGMPPSPCQSISFPPLASKVYGDPQFTLTATASSSLPVEFVSSDPTVAYIDNNLVTILKAGTITITASQDGNASFIAAAPVVQSLVVEKATLIATADDKAIFYGKTVPELTVSYSGFKGTDDASVIDSPPVATTTATGTSTPGLYPISLSGGSDNNYVITIVQGTAKIDKAKQTITLPEAPDKVLGDSPFAIVATASSGLPVTITSSSEKISISGEAITTVEAGSVTISASQAGNEFYDAAPIVEISFCINPPKPELFLEDSGDDSYPIIRSSSSSGNEWFLNSVLLEAENQPSIVVTESGAYTTIVKQDNCTSVLSDPLSMVVTGVIAESRLTPVLFPNPAANRFFVRLPSPYNTVDYIKVVDMKGTIKDVIAVQGRSEIAIDISGYPSGAYIVLANFKGFVFNEVILKK